MAAILVARFPDKAVELCAYQASIIKIEITMRGSAGYCMAVSIAGRPQLVTPRIKTVQKGLYKTLLVGIIASKMTTPRHPAHRTPPSRSSCGFRDMAGPKWPPGTTPASKLQFYLSSME